MRILGYRKWIAAGLAAVLIVSAAPSVQAMEAATEPTILTEPTVVTQPEETLPPAEPTDPTEATTVPTEPSTEPSTEPATEAPTQPAEETFPQEENQILSIAQALALPVGTDGITIQGTVVWEEHDQAILQDATGGIRLSFDADPETLLGEQLRITGCRAADFLVEDFESLGMGPLPFQDAALSSAPENLRVKISRASLSGGNLVQNGFAIDIFMENVGTISLAEAVDAWGVIVDGVFRADTLTAAKQPKKQKTTDGTLHPYFGLLHAHSSAGGGNSSPEALFQMAQAAGNMDFYAISDHGHSLNEEEWKAGLQAANAAQDLTGIYGYELSWEYEDFIGHISTFHTPSFRTPEAFSSLESYLASLTADSISQFNHPGREHGEFGWFENHSPSYDKVMHLIELGDGEDMLTYYQMALDEGWHLAPTFSDSEGSYSGSLGRARTVILAESSDREDLFAGIRAGRVYATQDENLALDFTLNGKRMGGTTGQSKTLTVHLTVRDPNDGTLGVVEVVGEKGNVYNTEVMSGNMQFPISTKIYGDSPYYFLRITQPDGDVAITAPVWISDYRNLGIRELGEVDGQLRLTLFNQEKETFLLESITLDAQIVGKDQHLEIPELEVPSAVPAEGSVTLPFDLTWENGAVKITAVVRGTINGAEKTFTESVTLVKEPPVQPIQEVRQGTLGQVYRVEGKLTTGTMIPYNTIPDTVYLQDETGGIAIVGQDLPEKLETGAHLQFTGVLRKDGGNLVLEYITCAPTGQLSKPYEPAPLSNRDAMDYETYGGQLVQITGKVQTLDRVGRSIYRMTIRDGEGADATILIGKTIRSYNTGENTLADKIRKGRTVRAVGLVHVDASGETVLRVRNCEEVQYIAPTPDYSNPQTGDRFWFLPSLKRKGS